MVIHGYQNDFRLEDEKRSIGNGSRKEGQSKTKAQKKFLEIITKESETPK